MPTVWVIVIASVLSFINVLSLPFHSNYNVSLKHQVADSTWSGGGMPSSSDQSTASVVLAIDTSDGMIGDPLVQVKQAAQGFITNLNSDIPVAVITFSSNVQTIVSYTTDKQSLISAIDGLKPSGLRVLYDGSLAAVKLAASSSTKKRLVILMTNGGQYSAQGRALAQDAVQIAKTQHVNVYTVSLSPAANREYLDTLATSTLAQHYHTNIPVELTSIYNQLSQQVMALASTASKVDASTAVPITLLSNTPALMVSSSSPSTIAPLEGSSGPLNVHTSGTTGSHYLHDADNADTAVSTTVPVAPASLPSNGTTVPVVTSGNTNPVLGNIVSNPVHNTIVPISISVDPDIAVKLAALVINGRTLITFTKAPYVYDLDTSLLSAGHYTLTFTTTNTYDVITNGSLDFEVSIPKNVSNSSAPMLSGTPSKSAATNPENSTLVAGAAPRTLLINGKAQSFNLTFSAAKGLAVISETSTTAASSPNTLGAILSQPFQIIPAPVRAALTAQHPTFWTIVILLLTIILLPQGLFTLYWMMYTWNNPEVAEKYRSPKTYLTPQHSFTAILPARHEKDVIRDTIRAVDRIDYPDALKEILIMIRDEDDEETIAAAQATINELGKDNIRLITFTTGPKNKPNGLNRGLKAATKEVVCVFDAEDEPHPELYNVINTVMVRDNADVVQAGVQLMNFKSTWFSALNCLEYFFWFKSGLHAFTRQFKVTPLGGNTVFFKRHYLEQIGGWDEKCLTEDADVGIRLTLQGAKIQIVYDEKHATREETPATADSFIKQRTRWCQGFYEIFRKGDWAKLPTLTQKIIAMYILLNSLLQAAIVLYMPIGIYVAVTQRIAVPVALLSYVPIFILLLQLTTNLIGIREFTAAYGEHLPLGFRLKMILFYYPYQLLMATSSIRAVHHFVTQQTTWEKTAHANLHRQAQTVTQGA